MAFARTLTGNGPPAAEGGRSGRAGGFARNITGNGPLAPRHVAGKVLNLSDATFDGAAGAPMPMMVHFWAPWCGASRIMAPFFDELATEYAGRALIAGVNLDGNPLLSARFEVCSLPNIKILMEGRPVENIIGPRPKQALRELLEAVLASRREIAA